MIEEVKVVVHDIRLIAIEMFKANLKGLILFGSGNSEDFVKGVSDLDFFIFLREITYEDLAKINKIKKIIISKFGISIDFKPIQIQELEISSRLSASCEFFNGWGMKAIKDGYQKIIYSTNDLEDLIKTHNCGISKFALERMYYYLHKLRKIVQGQKHIFNNTIKHLSENEKSKITISCFKNIITFYLAHNSIFVYTNNEVIQNCPNNTIRNFFQKLIENKSKNICDLEITSSFYNYIEEYIKHALGKKRNQ